MNPKTRRKPLCQKPTPTSRNPLALLAEIAASLLLPAAFAADGAAALSVAPAVEISWQSSGNTLYQLMASDDVVAPTWTEVGPPVPGTGAEVRVTLRSGDAGHRFYIARELPGAITNWIDGLSDLDFRPAKLTAQEGGILAEGLRATARGITREDLVCARFQFDMESQSLRLVQYEVVPQVGVFHDRFFAKDAPPKPVGIFNGGNVNEYTWIAGKGTNLVLNLPLETGHVLNYGVIEQSQEHTVELLGPDGQRLAYSINPARTGFIREGYPVLRPGTYQLRIRPRSTPPASMTCKFYFANNNGTSLREIADGGAVSATLRQNTHDYAKYKVRMAQGQTLRLADPGAGIGLLVLNSRSEALANRKDLPLIFEAPAHDVYYVFVYRILPGPNDLEYTSGVSVGN